MTTIQAIGHPITQGSKVRTQWGMRDSNGDRLKPWRDTVTAAAIDAHEGQAPIEGPVHVTVVFRFRRPASHYGTGRNAEKLKPSAQPSPVGRNMGDLDKLIRAVLDSVTTAGVWCDDSQVVSLQAYKRWCEPGELEGAQITVGPSVILVMAS